MDDVQKHIQVKKRPSISFKLLLYMSWQNIISKKLRSWLTIMGIIVGIGSIAFLVSFGLGLQKIVTDNVVGDNSIRSIEITTPNSKIIKLNTRSVDKIRTFPHIDKLGVAYSFPASVSLSGGGIDSIIYGIDSNFQEMTSLNLVEGRVLKPDDANSVIVSTAALKAIGISDSKKAINQSVDITVPLQYADPKLEDLKEKFKIVGIIDSGQDNEIFTTNAVFDAQNVPVYKQVKVIADDTANIAALRKQIESTGLQTSSPIDTLEQINQLFKFFNFILAGFGAIGIIVALLGMFNTLTISLLERTKEIGLMVTLGGRRRDMRRLFMLEASILSVIGALMGILLSYVGGKVVNIIVNQNASSRVDETFDIFSTPLWLILALVGFMLVVGLLVAFFPAKRAERINPIDALRRE
jgi:putative ABC transport system permease protein